ncbi:hypothetical protein M011DRAFT_385403, partial [Sporormia fimetaria CBS 119925]
RLPYPILIPQRRPGTRSRGFCRAYAPDLQQYGIDQSTFLQFMKEFHSASQASPLLHVVYVAASVISPIHEMITFAVSMSVTLSLSAVMDLQKRYKANCFLDQMNRDVFMPKGLYALVLVYKIGDSAAAENSGWGIRGPETGSSARGTSSKKVLRPFRNADGKIVMPLEVAPLVYPGSDPSVQDLGKKETLKERLKRNKKFVSEYYDRREMAEFTGNTAPNALSSTSVSTPFHSRFADPNHPVNNGSITALLTGG